jgi:hypothetical protein
LQRLANAAAATPARACSIILLIAGGRFALQADEIKTAASGTSTASGVVIRSVANPITTTMVVYVFPIMLPLLHNKSPPRRTTRAQHSLSIYAYIKYILYIINIDVSMIWMGKHIIVCAYYGFKGILYIYRNKLDIILYK